MSPRSRRHVLRSGVVFAAALAGCVSDSPPLGGDGETTTQGPTATDASTQTAATPTETQTPAYDTSVLTTSASVVTQATADHPAVVKLRLTNEGEEAIPIQPTEGGGYPLEYFPTLDGSETNLVLYPREPTHWQFFGGDELADSQTNGCWRFVTEEGEKPREGVQQLGSAVTIEPRKSYTIRHEVYDQSPEGPCRSAGEYRSSQSLMLAETHEEGPTKAFEYTLTVAGSGDISVVANKQ